MFRNDLNDVFTGGILPAKVGPTFVKYSSNLFAISTGWMDLFIIMIKGIWQRVYWFLLINNFVMFDVCCFLLFQILFCSIFFLVILSRWWSLFLHCINLNLFSVVGVLTDFLYSLSFVFSDLSSPLVKQRLVRCLLISLIVVIFCGKALL